MNELKIVIPGRLPGLNQYIDAERRHRMAGAAMKKTTQEDCMRAMISAKKAGITFEKCNIEFHWFEPNKRRDKDNIRSFGAKVILDALQKMGILKNDNWEYVELLTDRFSVDKKNPRVEVTISEAA